MTAVLDACWCRASARETAVLVDGAAYYRTLYRALLSATRSISIAAWQFDPNIDLIPDAAKDAREYPVSLWQLLNTLCARRPELEVRILAWDYSLVYAFERTWLELTEARLSAHPRVHFRWREHPDPRGSHHQKFVVIDGRIAFLGGLDLGKSRWDTREHDPDNPLRTENSNGSARPFHDVQAAVEGPAAEKLEELFVEAWQASEAKTSDTGSGAPLAKAPEATRANGAGFRLADATGDDVFLLGEAEVELVRTVPAGTADVGVQETRATFERMIREAERLIYIETQYFTSSAISRALIERMSRRDAPALQIVLVMPDGADSVKEGLVLGSCQQHVVSSLFASAEESGHAIRLVHSRCLSKAGERVATYVHSKLMIVDDVSLFVGSANLTNRSMGLDTELGLSLSAKHDAALSERIARLRASLLAEHAGGFAVDRFLAIEGLIHAIDECCSDEGSRLTLGVVGPPDRAEPLVLALFDPTTVFDHQQWDEIWEETLGLDQPGLLKRSWEAVKQIFSTKSAGVERE